MFCFRQKELYKLLRRKLFCLEFFWREMLHLLQAWQGEGGRYDQHDLFFKHLNKLNISLRQLGSRIFNYFKHNVIKILLTTVKRLTVMYVFI